MTSPQGSSEPTNTVSNILIGPHRLFDVPELVERILSFSSQGTCALLSRVSRSWTSLAQDRTWEQLTELKPLLGLLGDLKIDTNGEMMFVEVPASKDWARFNLAADRVRSFDYKDYKEDIPDDLISFVLACVRGTPDRAHLLPKLRRLVWTTRNGPQVPVKLLHFLSPSLPCLSSFTVHFDDPESVTCLPRFVNMAGPLLPSTIRSICITHVSATNLSPVSCVPGIRAMLYDKPDLYDFQLPPFDYPVSAVPFPFNGDLGTVFLSHTVEDEASALAFCITLVQSLPELVAVYLCFNSSPRGGRGVEFETLRPLLGVRALERLEVMYDRPLVLHSEHVREMGSAWPRLEALAIWPEYDASRYSDSATPIAVLADFADAFSERLEKLCHVFYIDEPIPSPWQLVRKRFARLSALSLGATRMNNCNPAECAVFVGTLFPYTEHFVATETFSPVTDCWSVRTRVTETSGSGWGEWYRVLRLVQDAIRTSLRIESEGRT